MKKTDYVRLDTLDTDVEKFIQEGYVNYTKRTGGQINQFYSLSDVGEDESGRYRETEVIFSREIFKRVVLTTKLFPIGVKQEAISSGMGITNKTKEDFYIRGRVAPYTVERSYAQLRFIGGEFRNIRKEAFSDDRNTVSSFKLLGGEFRLPHFDMYAPPESSKSTLRFVEGMLKRALIHTFFLESIQSSTAKFTEFTRNTSELNDVFELNFKTKTLPGESNKAYLTYVNPNAITLDTINSLSENASLRFLTKTAGLRVLLKGHSSQQYYGKMSMGIDFMLKELTPGGYILEMIQSHVGIRLNSLDPTQLEFIYPHEKATEHYLYTTQPNTVKKDVWYNLVLESDDSTGEEVNKIYLNNELLFTYKGISIPRTLFTDYGGAGSFILGNNKRGDSGLLMGLDRVFMVKNCLVVSESQNLKKTREIVAVDIDLSAKILSDRAGVEWTTDGSTEIVERNGRLAITNSMVSNEAKDLLILPANNYKIELEIEATRLPSYDMPKRLLLSDGQVFELSLILDADDVRLKFVYEGTELISYTTLKVNTIYKIEIMKVRDYILLVINGRFDSIVKYDTNIDLRFINSVTVGGGEEAFQGYLYSLKMINFYRDNRDYDQHYPENISEIVVLNFEEGYLDEGGTYRKWKEVTPGIASFAKFGGKSLKGVISVERDPGLSIGSNDFTFETWMYPQSQGSDKVLLTNGRSSLKGYAGLYPRILFTKDGKIAVKTGARKDEGYFVVSNDSVPLNQWSHVAVVKNGSRLHLYINGKRSGSSLVPPPPLDFSYDGTFIGNSNLGENTQFDGYLDSIRLVKGLPLYTTDTFEVPTTPASVRINTSLLRVTYEAYKDHRFRPRDYYYGWQDDYVTTRWSTTVWYTAGFTPTRQKTNRDVAYKEASRGDRQPNRHLTSPYPLAENGSFTYKMSFKLDKGFNGETYLFKTTRGGVFEARIFSLKLIGKKMSYHNNGIITELPTEIETDTWYVLTIVRVGQRVLTFIDGILIHDGMLFTEPLDSSTIPVVEGFPGWTEGMSWSSVAVHLDTHLVDYPIYFKEIGSFSRSGHDIHYRSDFSRPEQGTTQHVVFYDRDFTYVALIGLGTFSWGTSYKNDPERWSVVITKTQITLFEGNGALASKEIKTKDKNFFALSRKAGLVRVYMNGVKIIEHQTNPRATGEIKNHPWTPYYWSGDLYASGIRAGTEGFEGDTAPLYGSFMTDLKESDRDAIESMATDAYNIIPSGRVLDSDNVKLSPTSIWRSSAYFSNGKHILQRMPALPSKLLGVEFWIRPLSDGEVFKLKGISVVIEGRTLKWEGLSTTVLMDEWQHIRLVLALGKASLYHNGKPIASKVIEEITFEESDLTISGFTGWMDYIKIYRVPANIDIDARFDPLEEVIKESSIPQERVAFPNIDFRYGKTFWRGGDNIRVEPKTMIASKLDTISYTLDISKLHMDKTKIWISFFQQGLGGLKIRFYGVYKFLIHEVELALEDLEMTRYVSETLTRGITHIELEFTFASKISNLDVSFEEIMFIRNTTPASKLPVIVEAQSKVKRDYGHEEV